MGGVKDAFLASLQQLASPDPSAFRTAVKAALGSTVIPMLDFAAAQFGLGGLKDAVRRAIGFVPLQADQVLRTAVRGVAATVQGTAPGGPPAEGTIRTAAVSGGRRCHRTRG
jgi:hypothetical protein